jgi:hypothetical protein
MRVVIFVLGEPQRSEDATKKKHHGDDEFLFLCRSLKLRIASLLTWTLLSSLYLIGL